MQRSMHDDEFGRCEATDSVRKQHEMDEGIGARPPRVLGDEA